MFLNTKAGGLTLVQGTGEICSSCFASCSHNQQCISVECQVPDVPFDAGKQPICSMTDTLKMTDTKLMQFFAHSNVTQRTAVAQWLRFCATNRKVAGSILDVVNGIFH